ncbi:MAG: hypothetical protein RBT60_07755 [Candidatus Krumholzibacteria bacterium]|nr:hypothetical protein [Candidatus Krumholzibacteria bacterium]
MRSCLMTIVALAAIPAFWLPTTAGADELPAQVQRIWAPDGDQIGQTSHATVTLLVNDVRGDQTKAAEDWSLLGEIFGYGLFAYHRLDGVTSRRIAWRGAGGNVEGSGLAGDIGFATTLPGVYGVRIDYSAHDLYYDRDSEVRAVDFQDPPAPPALGATPHLSWQRGAFDFRYQVADGLQIKLGASDLRRDGSKASLLRGTFVHGDSPPQVQAVDKSRINEIWLGGTYSTGRLASELRLSFRGSDGTRAYVANDPHERDEERKEYQGRLAAAYDVTPATRLLVHGGLSRLELLGNESWGSQGRAAAVDGDTETQAGQLAVVSRLNPVTVLRASARFSGQQSDIRVDEDQRVLYAADRTRDRQEYRVLVDNASLRDTRLRLQYRYSKTNQENTTAQDDRPDWNPGDTQTLDQEATRHDLALTSRTRLSRQARLKLGVQWMSVEVDQDRTWDTESGDPWYGVLGDHKRTRLGWDLALQWRPRRNLPLDLGYQGRDQTLERTERGGAETTWQANRLFATVNWLATGKLTVYGMASYGKETYELVGVEDPAATMGAFNYDGTTARFMPGAVLQVTRTLQLEGMYEGIHYENTGHESARLSAVEADHDRGLVRARWQARPRLAVSAAYRRNMLDENRWDDYIQDLYSVSVSGTF